MPRFDIVRDNPMLTKHIRSRLRPSQVLPWAVVILVVCLCIVFAAQAFNLFRNGLALSMVLGLELIILAAGGSQQVAGSVGGARESSVLDYHRVSPQKPSWLALGYFLGAPAREYVLVAVTAPFALGLAILSPAGILGLLQVWVVMLIGCWILHAVALLASLSAKKPKGATRGSMIGLLVFGLFMMNPISAGLYAASSTLTGQPLSIPFFGLPLYWLLFVVLYGLTTLGFLLLACTRKMRSDRAHVFTKPEALACMLTLAVMLLGAFWAYEGVVVLPMVMVYALLVAGGILVSTITPQQAEYLRGMRRAHHEGRRRPLPWTTEASNQAVLYITCAIVFLAPTILIEVLRLRQTTPGLDYSLSIAVAVFVLAYLGLGQQYLSLRAPKNGRSLFVLFLFLVWVVPLVGGSIAAGAGSQDMAVQLLLGFSPVTGIAMASRITGELMRDDGLTGGRLVRMAAILPAIGFAFVFNYMLMGLQRRIDRAVRKADLKGQVKPNPLDPEGDYDMLEVVEA